VYAPTWLGMLAGLLGAVAVVSFGFAWAMRIRRRPKDPVVAAYNKFSRKLAKAGFVREPTEGAKSFAERSAQGVPAQRASIHTITDIYNELRYGEGSKTLLLKFQKLVKEFELSKHSAT
ncbi:MAG: hypothetical protein AMS22_13355, partial [Thiotrichales bacterium SG8_50]